MYSSWHIDFPEIELAHINVLELFTVLLALIRWGPQLAGSHVLILSDNSVMVTALNKTTSKGSEIMPLVRQIFWLCVNYDITITSVFIAGKLNILADGISRMDDFNSASYARLILANFDCFKLIPCSGHMSQATFLWLQGRWIKASGNS